MELILFVGILAINTFISWANCRTVGLAWKDVMAGGSWFEKALLWCGAIQSSIGFSMLFMLPLGFGGLWYMGSGAEPMITQEQAHELLKGMFSLWYILIIFPLLGSGLMIWVHSVRVAIQTRRWQDMAVAGWNTFAQISNTVSAVNNLGGAWGDVGKLFSALTSSKDGNGKAAGLVIALVILALLGGIMLTFALIRHYASKSTSVLLEKARERERFA